MSNPNLMYTCVHGHFYQPPRENPWLEVIEREPSAHPMHDWNERIADECYQPNAAARVVGRDNRVLSLLNNYQHMSFNVGATLMRWLELHRETAYRLILDADLQSLRATGHGNALAQVYNHIIMPLANARDKVTQIKWGIRDFEKRFKRRPLGMWLAETAVDQATIDALVDNDIAFTVLSPFQARGFRYLDGSHFNETPDGSIPTGRAYRVATTSKKPFHVFFYDPTIAKKIAFESVLADANHLLGLMRHHFANRQALGARDNEPWLIHTATDGESYGHHFRFGDMALASAHKTLLSDPAARIVNYAQFLSMAPVIAEAELLPVSAWSCAHGVGRWSTSCGCNMSGPSMHQLWREPLRAALDHLRDALAMHFEREMTKLGCDPWATRDAYIDVVTENISPRDFANLHAKKARDENDIVKFLQLLEMQRCTLLMYTSCGWFFDDVSGPESVILLRYAARAIALGQATGIDTADAFEADLTHVPSNQKDEQGAVIDGKRIYLHHAKTAVVTERQLVVSHALRHVVPAQKSAEKSRAFKIEVQDEITIPLASNRCVVGRIRIEDTRSLQSVTAMYAMVHFGGLDFRCGIALNVDVNAFRERLNDIKKTSGSALDIMKMLERVFPDSVFSLDDATADVRAQCAELLSLERFSLVDAVSADLFENHRGVLHAVKRLSNKLPSHIEALITRVMSKRIEATLEKILENVAGDPTDDSDATLSTLVATLHSDVSEASDLAVKLQITQIVTQLDDTLVDAVQRYARHPSALTGKAALRLAEACAAVGHQPHLWELLVAANELRQSIRQSRIVDEEIDRRVKSALDSLCASRFFASNAT